MKLDDDGDDDDDDGDADDDDGDDGDNDYDVGDADDGDDDGDGDDDDDCGGDNEADDGLITNQKFLKTFSKGGSTSPQAPPLDLSLVSDLTNYVLVL